jgi:hypothetical protein
MDLLDFPKPASFTRLGKRAIGDEQGFESSYPEPEDSERITAIGGIAYQSSNGSNNPKTIRDNP